MIRTGLAAMALATLTAFSVGAQNAPERIMPAADLNSELADLIGKSAEQGTQELEVLGYRLIQTEGEAGLWQGGEADDCFRVITTDGNFSAITRLPPRECRRIQLL